MSDSHQFVSLLRAPDLVRAFGSDGEIPLNRAGNDVWEGSGAMVASSLDGDSLIVELESPGKVSLIQLRWRGDLSAVKRFLGDHWERSYGDLEWRGDVPNRVMPWYFMANTGAVTHGYGVVTGANAFCFWMADAEGISLWADVRSGGVPVELGDRRLTVAKVVCREGLVDESAFAATTAFCRQMYPNRLAVNQPIYGTNDWNYAYGKNSAALISEVSKLISDLSPNSENRPYSVIDEGWAEGPYNGKFGHGPWVGNPNFGDMGEFAGHLHSLGVRPGIWFRPLTPLPDSPPEWSMSRSSEFLDPTHPAVKEHVAQYIRQLTEWGYELIKHDFTTWDLFGRWGFEMGGSQTRDGWRLHDASRTNAEVIKDLYQVIREAAGSARLIGCNTVGHLAAGTHEVQRTGDDTSGRSWNRNRKMGVNTLAFRAAQQGTFFEVDPDIVAITKAVPWYLVEQWLRLVSESGTSLFVAVEPSVIEPHHRSALSRALDLASCRQSIAEPLDWMDRDCPRRWNLRGQTVDFNWMGESGAWPFAD